MQDVGTMVKNNLLVLIEGLRFVHMTGIGGSVSEKEAHLCLIHLVSKRLLSDFTTL